MKEHWLDRHIEEQKKQREILALLAHPYDPADLCCNLITENEELIMSNMPEVRK